MPVNPAEVLHTGSLNDGPLRFFRSPLDGPDLPWVSAEDLGKALDLSRSMRRSLAKMPSHIACVRTVVVDGDLVDIIPHYAAQGLIQAVIELGAAVPADSDDVGRAFRLMSATCSDRSRPAVPIDVGRGGGRPLVWMDLFHSMSLPVKRRWSWVPFACAGCRP